MIFFFLQAFLRHVISGPTARWFAAAIGLAAASARLQAQADGSLRWAYSTTGFVQSSPAVGPDGTVYVGVRLNTTPSRGLVLAIKRDGSQKWPLFSTTDWVDSSPAIAPNGTVYVGCWDGKLYAINPDGTRKWVFETSSYIYSSPAIGGDGTIYFGAGDSALHAVGADGLERWKFPTGNWVDSSPAVAADGSIYFGSWDTNIYGVRPDGTEKWRVATGAAVLSSPAIGADGTVYIGSEDSRLYAVAADGAVRWKYATGAAIDASPVIGADGTIYVGSNDKFFYAINPDGTTKWKVSAGRAVVSSAAVRADGTIIFGGDDGLVHALNSDGTPKWNFPTLDYVESSPVIAADGSIYVGSLDGKLYSLNGTTAPVSPLSTYGHWPMLHRDAAHRGTAPAQGTGARLINLATRGPAGNGAILIAGLVVQGTAPKTFLLRAVGPTLEQLFVPGSLADPTITLKASASGATLLTNNNWCDDGKKLQIVDTTVAAGAFPLPENSKDAVVVATLQPGAYTTLIDSADGGAGVALVEAYDAASSTPNARLVNLSTRGHVGTGANVLIAGLVINGDGAMNVLVRAVGPGLAGFNVTGALVQPTLTVFAGDGTPIRNNTGWISEGLKGDLAGAARRAGAFAFAEGSADCAALVSLGSGSYTIKVSGVGDTTGEALVEVYVVP